ncbi:MAG: hypothetical protein M1327_04980 [Candidatus Thermoplasmatota archaeon]|nr:hypothetical protein [Candidatus Thermoplasmatota archaeon]
MADKKQRDSYFATEGLLLVVAFITAVAILLTDKNLQTDFQTVPKYFYHWYGMLVIALISLIGGVLITVKHNTFYGKVGVIGSSLIAIFLVADIATYSTLNVGLTASQFAGYLFSFSRYDGFKNYIPGLYPLLFIEFILVVIVGVIGLKKK